MIETILGWALAVWAAEKIIGAVILCFVILLLVVFGIASWAADRADRSGR